MIAREGTFEYQAEFTAKSFNDSDIDLHGASQRLDDRKRLVGNDPRIRFWNERLVLIAAAEHNASARNMSAPIGDAVHLAAQPGDRLYVIRTGAGAIGLSLLREERLVLAIGCVTAVPLGKDIKIIRRQSGPRHLEDFRGLSCDTWLEFTVGSEHLNLKDRDEIEVGGYHLYLEHRCFAGVPGVDECVSISIADKSALRIAAMRSAILLGNGYLKITRWDGSELVTDLYAR